MKGEAASRLSQFEVLNPESPTLVRIELRIRQIVAQFMLKLDGLRRVGTDQPDHFREIVRPFAQHSCLESYYVGC